LSLFSSALLGFELFLALSLAFIGMEPYTS